MANFTIQCENFNAGGEGVGYHDLDVGDTDVGPDLEAADGGTVISFAFAGEWLKYDQTVSPTGTYTLAFRVASSGVGGTFHIEQDGVDVTGAITVPDTGSFSTFTTITKTGVALTAGARVFKLVMDTNGGSTAVGNFNWWSATLEIVFAGAVTGVATAAAALTTQIRMAGAVAGSATISASFGFNVALMGLMIGRAMLTGSVAAVLAGTITGAATATASLTTLKRMAGTVSGTATVTAVLKTGWSVPVLAGTATVTASLTAAIRLAGSVVSTAVVSATFFVPVEVVEFGHRTRIMVTV